MEKSSVSNRRYYFRVPACRTAYVSRRGVAWKWIGGRAWNSEPAYRSNNIAWQRDGDRFYGIEHSTGQVTLAWHVHVMRVSRGAVLQNAKHHVLPIPEFSGRVMGRSKHLSR